MIALKYIKKDFWIIAGVVCIVAAVFGIGIAISMIRSGGIISLLSSFGILIMIIITFGIYLGVSNLKIDSIDYITLNDNSISIHRGILIRRMTINYDDIKEGRIVNDKLVLCLKKGIEFVIHFHLISTKDVDRLKKELNKKIEIK